MLGSTTPSVIRADGVAKQVEVAENLSHEKKSLDLPPAVETPCRRKLGNAPPTCVLDGARSSSTLEGCRVTITLAQLGQQVITKTAAALLRGERI